MPKLLLFVKKTDPILRQIMPEERDFNNPALLETINDMCYSILPDQLVSAGATINSAAGMAANQWGIKRRVFIFTPEGSGATRLEVILNPSYQPFTPPGETEPQLIAAFEGCFSVPLTASLVNRYQAITATYYNLEGSKIERILEGWEARIFQHETDHLNGKLVDGRLDNFPGPECTERIIFKDKEEMEDFWINRVRPSRKK